MLFSYNNFSPEVHSSSYVAPNALICGNVKIGKNCRILFGAQLIAEGSSINIGDNCIILENAVIQGTENFPVSIGYNCLIGPNSHLVGCSVENNVFIATGATIFHGAKLMSGSEVRIDAVVNVKTVLPENTSVPINWIAVGDPACLFSQDKNKKIWKFQTNLNFSKTVYGIDRPSTNESNNIAAICKEMFDKLSFHFTDYQVNLNIDNKNKT